MMWAYIAIGFGAGMCLGAVLDGAYVLWSSNPFKRM